MASSDENGDGAHSRIATVLPFSASYFQGTRLADERVALRYQESFLPYLVGEYLKLGALRIAIPADDPTADYTQDLSGRLKDCVIVVDQAGRVRRRLDAFMEPILDEFPVKFPWGDYFPRAADPSDPAVGAVIATRRVLYKLLLGMEYHLQIDLNVARARHALLFLSQTLKSNDGRINVNRTMGLLKSYTETSVDSLDFVSQLPEDRVREFEKLLDNELFQQLSRSGYYLGVPGKFKLAMHEITKLAKILNRNRRAVFKFASAPVSVVTGRLVDTGAAAELIPEGRPSYLPPIAWFSAARERAKASATPAAPVSAAPRKFVVMPGRFRNLEALEDAARKVLGARLRTHCSDKDEYALCAAGDQLLAAAGEGDDAADATGKEQPGGAP